MRARTKSGRRVDLGITASATAASVVSTMPAFLVGASSVLLRAEIPMSDALFGAGVSLFFGAASVTSVGGGRLAERLGARPTLAISASLSAAGLLGIALMPGRSGWLLVLLAVSGVAHGVAQPATNLVLTTASPSKRQAFRFGVKQAAVPLATLLAGASVPIVGATIGWRWAFAFAAAAALALAITLGVRSRPYQYLRPTLRKNEPRTRVMSGPLVALALAAGVGSSAATALASFLAETATGSGFSIATTGWIMALGSLVGIVSRLTVGWFSPPEGKRALTVIATMLFVGAIGYLLLASGSRVAIIVGTTLAFAFGWGWPGLFHFAVVSLHPHAPGAASGIGQAGASAGAAAGPFVFGAIVTVANPAVAWGFAALAAIAGGAAVLAARRWMESDRSSFGGLQPISRGGEQ